MSVFTSLYPSVHGVETTHNTAPVRRLPSEVSTLAEVLRANGFVTMGLHAGGNVEGTFGFDRGFDEYRRASFPDAAIHFLRAYDGDAPFFLFTHTYHVHDPYMPEPPGDLRFADPAYEGLIIHRRGELERLAGTSEWSARHKAFWDNVNPNDPADAKRLGDLYDALLVELDTKLARLLRAIGSYAPKATLIVFSDHGEEFGEHGRFRHSQLYQEVLHVPLLIRLPDRRSRRVSTLVSLIDLAPTILDLSNVPIPEQFQGRSLLELEEADKDELPVFGEHRGLRTVIKGQFKLVARDAGVEIYDLASDPDELDDLSDSTDPYYLDRRRALEELLSGFTTANQIARTHYKAGVTRDHDGASLNRLRALGYIED